MESDVWARVADRFVDDHYRSARGRVRSYLIAGHLSDHLNSPPGPIADVGGGAGTQSIPLGRLGYEVTILDSSPAMLDKAAAALTVEPDEVAARVRLVEAGAEAATEHLGVARFDGVLCHGVLPYVDEPGPLVAELCKFAAPGGIVSIVAKNRHALAVGPALEGNWSEALEAFDATGEVNRLGLPTRADTVEGLSELLTESEVTPVAWFGLRLFTDGWTEAVEPADLPEAMFAVELEASRRDPYRQLSRLFHLIGRKRV